MEKKRIAKTLRTIARVIGLIITSFFLAMLIGDAVQSIQSEGFKGITKEVLFVLMPVTIALAAFLISWWLELSGGILLVISYLALSLSPAIHAIYYGPGFQIYIGMFAFAAPFLISGVLLIVAAQLSRRAS